MGLVIDIGVLVGRPMKYPCAMSTPSIARISRTTQSRKRQHCWASRIEHLELATRRETPVFVFQVAPNLRGKNTVLIGKHVVVVKENHRLAAGLKIPHPWARKSGRQVTRSRMNVQRVLIPARR